MTVEIYRREAWQEPGYKVYGPAPKKKTTHVVAHWPGSNTVPVGLDATFEWLRTSQKNSLKYRGYSFYYNWMIPKGADAIIEIRGDDFNNAANAVDDDDDDNENDWTKSILIAIPVGQTWDATQKKLWIDFVNENYKGLGQMGHKHLEPTLCPGDIAAELPLYLPPTTPPEQDDVMFVAYVRMEGTPAVYRQWSNGTKTWVSNPGELSVYAFLEGKSLEQIRNDIKVLPNADWLRAAGVIVGPIPPGVDGWGVPK